MTKPEDTPSAIVIGSGFAGAVTACRLAQAGFRVSVLERGRDFAAASDFPVHPRPTDPNVPPDKPDIGGSGDGRPSSLFLWQFGKGIWDFRDLGGVVLGQAAGWGGGSLIYANVHLRPPPHSFDERWPEAFRHRGELNDYFDLVAKTLNATVLPHDLAHLPKRVQLNRASADLNRLQLERPGIEPNGTDPYLRAFAPPLAISFDGNDLPKDDPRWQEPCNLRGNCCLGCPTRAKNTLDLNYLLVAEETGNVEKRTSSEVLSIQRDEANDEFVVVFRDVDTGAEDAVRAPYVFLCAGAVNTTELLMRSSEAGYLDVDSEAVGSRFHPNQDGLYAVFDCDEPQELERGPTITSSLLYDREPDEGDQAARWRLPFREGVSKPRFATKVTSSSDGEAVVASPAYVITGAYETKNATGELVLSDLEGEFREGDELRCDGELLAVVDAPPSKTRHWFLIQDGGLPVDMEPAMGVFRSPLWLGRNGFREAKRPPGELEWPPKHDAHSDVEHASFSQRIGYASSPFGSLKDLLPQNRHSLSSQPPEVTELGTQLLSWAKTPRDDERDEGRWRLLPDQLRRALERLQARTLDSLGLATEGIVASFLDDAADEVAVDLNPALRRISNAEGSQIEELNLARRGLRLGVQLLWGSQSGLARAMAERILEQNLLGRGSYMEQGLELLGRLLDYRLGNGRAAMLLAMGLDSMPGRLTLDVPLTPRAGVEIRGGDSGARATLVGAALAEGTSFARGNATGRFTVTAVSGRFRPDEHLFEGRRRLGKFEELNEVDSNGSGTPKLHALHFQPVSATDSQPPAMAATVRAELPDAVDTPERGTQERILRDIASAWDGELRTDPLWTFSDRRLTVHPQGGCPMGVPGRSVTSPEGEVHGCPGLYVMDAAAFPASVGANPSASIAAIAEWKVEKFLEDFDAKRPGALEPNVLPNLEKARKDAKEWVDERGRKQLDPFGAHNPPQRSLEPAHQPVGIEFSERMEGWLGPKQRGLSVATELTLRIDDLADFLARHERDSSVRIPVVRGRISYDSATSSSRGLESDVDPSESYMIVMAGPEFDERGHEERRIIYDLAAKDGTCALRGQKIIKDDPGLDAWTDTTTLFIEEWTEKDPSGTTVVVKGGELALPAVAFFEEQLRSFKADTDDAARQAWAMAAFGKFFLGHLAWVYLPGLDRLAAAGMNLARRGHG